MARKTEKPRQSTLRAEAIYASFSREEERAFLFPGGTNPMTELLYVEQGSLHSVADGRKLNLQQGDMVIYDPSQWHMQYADTDVSPRCYRVFFEMTGDLKPLKNRKFTATAQTEQLLLQMIREQERTEAFSDEMTLALLNQLMVLLMRQVDGKPLPTSRTNGEYRIIHRAQVYVSTHIWDDLSVPYVAHHVDMSPSYLTALFHKHLDISPGEYIRRVKLQESKHMIRENKLNFTEIAAELQYSTVHHFSRQFKEKFGMTPSEYAKMVRSAEL
ncbi:MAG: AraC family transcriptional regulator [Firmicutes bacterium]|nr:AraC family transcriptional regulator [Bacillota bacterium]